MSKIETDQTIWNYSPEAKIWSLFNNLNYVIPHKYLAALKDENQLQDKKEDKPTLFFQSKARFELQKGTKVYSKSHGYGIIQDFGKNSKTFSIKCGAEIIEESFSNLLIDFPLLVRIISFQNIRDDVIRISPFATSTDILSQLTNLLSSNQSFSTSLQQISIFDKAYFNGKPLEKTHQSLEELKIKPFSKLLVVTSQGIVKTLSRFSSIYDGWGYSANQLEVISFSVSKPIWFVGFGVFGPDKGTYSSDQRPTQLNMTAMIHQGVEVQGIAPLQEKSFSIETMLEEKIYKAKFSKPVQIMPDTQYSISLLVLGGYSYYGNDGKQLYTSDDDIVFKFDYNNQSQGSDYSCGQFPEIYYFTN